MKKVVSIILALLVGGFVGFFGVFASVFSDGGLTERLITIAVILLIYLLLGAVFGYILPQLFWKWGLILSAPGVVLLILYLLKERNIYYVLYIVLMLILSCSGANFGAKLRINKR